MSPCPEVIHASYPSKEAAEAAARQVAARAHELLRAIRCRMCGYWRLVRVS